MSTSRTWTFTVALQQRAAAEGWNLSSYFFTLNVRVQPTDSGGPFSPSPEVAIARARAAGVPCLVDGTFPRDLWIDVEPPPPPSLDAPEALTPPFDRTVCDCAADRVNCRTQPGYLLPRDLTRIAAFLNLSLEELGRRYLCASLGAVVGDTQGFLFRIPTITPRVETNRASSCARAAAPFTPCHRSAAATLMCT